MSLEEPQSPGGKPYYVGNAGVDNVRDSGWFIGQFVPESLGLRHQTAVEVKWGVHPRGERRPGGLIAYGTATTVSIVLRGSFRTTVIIDGIRTVLTLDREGDYIIFGPDLAHEWEMLDDSVILSVRFPSVDLRRAKPEL